MSLPNYDFDPTLLRSGSAGSISHRPVSASVNFSRIHLGKRPMSGKSALFSNTEIHGFSRGFESFEKDKKVLNESSSFQNKFSFLREKSTVSKLNRSNSFSTISRAPNEPANDVSVRPSRKANYNSLHKALAHVREHEELLKENIARLDKTLEGFANDKTWNFKGVKLVHKVLGKTAPNGFQEIRHKNRAQNDDDQPIYKSLRMRDRSKPQGSASGKNLLLLSRKSCMSFFQESDNFDAYLQEKLLKTERETSSPTLRITASMPDSVPVIEEPKSKPLFAFDSISPSKKEKEIQVHTPSMQRIKTDPGHRERTTGNERYGEDEISNLREFWNNNDNEDSLLLRKSSTVAFASIRGSVDLDRTGGTGDQVEVTERNMSPHSIRANANATISVRSTRPQSPFIKSSSGPIHSRPPTAKKRVKMVSLSKDILHARHGGVDLIQTDLEKIILQRKQQELKQKEVKEQRKKEFVDYSKTLLQQKPKVVHRKPALAIRGKNCSDFDLRNKFMAQIDERFNSSKELFTTREITTNERDNSVERKIGYSLYIKGKPGIHSREIISVTNERDKSPGKNRLEGWRNSTNESRPVSAAKSMRPKLAF